MPKRIPIKYYRYISPKEVFLVPVRDWPRFNKEDQKFLRKNKTFYLKQLGYPLVHIRNSDHYTTSTYYVEEI